MYITSLKDINLIQLLLTYVDDTVPMRIFFFPIDNRLPTYHGWVEFNSFSCPKLTASAASALVVLLVRGVCQICQFVGMVWVHGFQNPWVHWMLPFLPGSSWIYVHWMLRHATPMLPSLHELQCPICCIPTPALAYNESPLNDFKFTAGNKTSRHGRAT